ncbi:MAG: HU family DNA-binding protein [Chloroflexi bacterium]|nr:HU family DNA-binding protein [Chloroflexota bacterium]MBI3733012.1 HU family DNA-binding protein [Chloroflexota bacterium]
MPMSKSQVAAALADKVGINKKQSTAYLDALAELAYEQAKYQFTLPGLGKLVLKDRPARAAKHTFGDKKGQEYTIPAGKVVRFRLSKTAKDAILGAKK